MADQSKDRILLPTDILYLVTFALGMGVFWLSGKASSLMPRQSSQMLAIVSGIGITAAVYGLGMALLSLVVLRRFGRSIVASTLIAIVLGIAAAQVIARVFAPMIHSKNDLGILTFGLYVCYGAIYVIGLAVARKLART